MNRRAFIAGAISSPLAHSARALAQTPVYLGDMHFHSFFAESKYHLRPMAQSLARGNVTLASWALVGDLLWFDVKTYKQKSVPGAAESFSWFQRELGRIKAHIAEQRLKIALAPRDVDLALAGDPHIVLSVEGASFVDSQQSRAKIAFDLGIRQLQLVHYIGNAIGDFQTGPVSYNGLSDPGKRLIAECNKLGMLIDLAHCSETTVTNALAASRVPMVWSHGSVAKKIVPAAAVWRQRQLSLDVAKEIAGKGGVVGLWALAPDVGKSIESYGDRLLELAEWLGEDHVAFGTDINGLGPYASFSTYADLRRVIEHWRRSGIAETKIKKIALGNFARVLKTAMEMRA